MQTLDQLISNEEMRIEHLLKIRGIQDNEAATPGSGFGTHDSGHVVYDLEKAYEQLAIYKIRKLMEF